MHKPSICNNVLELIGNTPLLKLNKLPEPNGANVYLKMESYNPSESLKDRIILKIIEDAERTGKLKPGGVIVEGTSGNTGSACAFMAAAKGYKCIVVLTDKQSREKVEMSKSFGADVIVTSYQAHADAPEYYLNLAKKIAEETPNSLFVNQFNNPLNPLAHYEMLGPEIWKQTEGKIDVFVMGMGTGGTISGVGKYLKEQNPNIKIIGADPVGSIIKKFFDSGDMSGFKPYKVEGIGEDIIPETLHLKYVDEMIYVSDVESFTTSRRLMREEGISSGGSTGTQTFAAMQYAKKLGQDKMVVTLCSDSGLKYISTHHSDEWMKEHRLFNPEKLNMGLIAESKTGKIPQLVTVDKDQSVTESLSIMNEFGLSQIPVIDNGKAVGTIHDREILTKIFEHKINVDSPVSTVMDKPLTHVEDTVGIQEAREILKKNSAVLVQRKEEIIGVVTRIDILDYA